MEAMNRGYQAAMHSLLSAFAHETEYHQFLAMNTIPTKNRLQHWPEDESPYLLRIELPHLRQVVFVPARAQTSFGALRLAGYPVVAAADADLSAAKLLQPHTLAALLFDELVSIDMVPMTQEARAEARASFLQRATASAETQEVIFREAASRMNAADQTELDFIAYEQSLWTGHPLHPVPKSRLGFNKDETLRYSPETSGHFALHYLLVAPELIRSEGTDAMDPQQVLLEFLQRDAAARPALKQLASKPHFRLLPLHPWQAKEVLQHPLVAKNLASGQLIDLGCLGPEMKPTTSIRTVYHEDCPFMLKLSLGVEITNSKRLNKEHELWRGSEIHRLLKQTKFGDLLQQECPEFEVLTDPGSLALVIDDTFIEESASTFRLNPFTDKNMCQRVVPIAALCEMPQGKVSLLEQFIQKHASCQGLTKDVAAEAWFNRYLALTLDTYLTIYMRHGLAFEAHQQNTILALDDDFFPIRSYYRDNQGVFHRDTAHGTLTQYLPGLGEQSGSIGPEALVDERLAYYLVINNILGLANVVAASGLLSEIKVFDLIRAHLKALLPIEAATHTSVVSYLLRQKYIPGKANFMTRVRNMDELVGDPRFQSVYLQKKNPLWIETAEDQAISETKYFDSKTKVTYAIKPFDLERDYPTYAAWMRLDYVNKWWKLGRSDLELRLHLRRMLGDAHQNLYMVSCDGVPVAYVERYWVLGDVLSQYITFDDTDQGFHLLVGDPSFLRRGLAEHLLVVLTRFCLDLCPEAKRVLGEPDVGNQALLRHAENTGFNREGTLAMADKEAAFMVAYREPHFARFSHVEAR